MRILAIFDKKSAIARLIILSSHIIINRKVGFCDLYSMTPGVCWFVVYAVGLEFILAL